MMRNTARFNWNGNPLMILAILVWGVIALSENVFAEINAAEMAKSVKITRDTWGVPHIEGPTDASCAFGVAYCQAEDYFWQIEDAYMQSIGRCAEGAGIRGLKTDLLCRNFEVPSRSQADYDSQPAAGKAIAEAYVAGLNYYLEKHPEVKPRLITKFEPWMVLAFSRYTMLYWVFERTGAKDSDLAKWLEEKRDEAKGSNLWMIGPSRTKDKTAMLFVNPHQPWFGIGQWWEGHTQSGEGLNFSGATFFGGPYLTIGHNEYLGWTHTANKPDIGDIYREKFDDPANPLNYKYDGAYRTATEWKETIKIKKPGNGDSGYEERTYTMRKTHHGPVIAKEDDQTYLTCRIAQLFEGDRLTQGMKMAKAKNFQEFYDAVAGLNILMFNIGYADRDGNIWYAYHGAVPKRDPSFDYAAVVDGTTSKTEWQGLHPLAELPQVLNPATGFLQNCNQSAFTPTDYDNPYKREFPAYMTLEANYDNRRAEVSRLHLRELRDVTFEDWQRAVTDTTMLWPKTQMPRFKRELDALKNTNPDLAAQAEPYLAHLLDWDYVNSATCTQSVLCFEWYEEMFGRGAPSEVLETEYIQNPEKKFEALVRAAKNIEGLWGTWKVPYGDVFRIQRHPNVSDILTVPFKDDQPSVPCVGTSGALGASDNVYYSPASKLLKRRYGVVGGSIMAVYEFGKERVKAMTLIQFGQSADPNSSHFDDQAKLYSEKKFKPGWYYPEEIAANTERTYHPGE